MPDVVDSSTRSRMMSGISGKNTGPELRVRRRLHAAGLRYRIHAKELPGRPDVVFRPIKTALFIHGCFWHQHSGCRLATKPHSNSEFWRRKLASNVERDVRVENDLRSLGWIVKVIWECAGDDTLDTLCGELAKAKAARQARRGSATTAHLTLGSSP